MRYHKSSVGCTSQRQQHSVSCSKINIHASEKHWIWSRSTEQTALENLGCNKQSREEGLEESNNCGKWYRKLPHQGITEIWSEENTDCKK